MLCIGMIRNFLSFPLLGVFAGQILLFSPQKSPAFPP